MADKVLNVPYKSQHDPDSTKSNTDCGAASLAMCLEFFGTKITTGEILDKLKDYDFLSLQQLAQVASDLGFKADARTDVPFSAIKKYIDEGKPVIVVGGYGYLNSTQEKAVKGDKGFKGSHIMVVTGYRDDDSVYVNDPDFWGDMRAQGERHNYTAEEFTAFWRNEGNAEGNSPNTLFVISKKEEPKPTGESVGRVEVTAVIGLRARTEPLINKTNIVRSYSPGVQLDVLETVKGVMVDGSDVWYKVKDTDSGKDVYIWSGATKVVSYKQQPEQPKAPEQKPNVEVPKVTDDYLNGILTVYKMTRDILKKNNALPVEESSVGFWAKIRETFKI